MGSYWSLAGSAQWVPGLDVMIMLNQTNTNDYHIPCFGLLIVVSGQVDA